MGFAWKGLFPMALFNMFLVALEILLLQDPETGALLSGELWIMVGINWALAVVAIVVVAHILGQKRLERPDPVPSPLANMRAGFE